MFINMDSKEQNNCSKNANMRGNLGERYVRILGFYSWNFFANLKSKQNLKKNNKGPGVQRTPSTQKLRTPISVPQAPHLLDWTLKLERISAVRSGSKEPSTQAVYGKHLTMLTIVLLNNTKGYGNRQQDIYHMYGN